MERWVVEGLVRLVVEGETCSPDAIRSAESGIAHGVGHTAEAWTVGRWIAWPERGARDADEEQGYQPPLVEEVHRLRGLMAGAEEPVLEPLTGRELSYGDIAEDLLQAEGELRRLAGENAQLRERCDRAESDGKAHGGRAGMAGLRAMLAEQEEIVGRYHELMGRAVEAMLVEYQGLRPDHNAVPEVLLELGAAVGRDVRAELDQIADEFEAWAGADEDHGSDT